jgi:hypothetical protein
VTALDALVSDDRRDESWTSVRRRLARALAHASVDELWRTLDEVDWMISSLDVDDDAPRAIMRAFADLLALEARLHDVNLDRELQSLLDAPPDPGA